MSRPAVTEDIPAGPPRPIDAGDSIRQGARALFSNLLPWVMSLLIVMALLAAFVGFIVVPVAFSDLPGEEGAVLMSPSTVAALILATVVGGVLSVVWSLNAFRNAVRQVQGEEVSWREFFRLRDLGFPFVTWLVVSLAVWVGLWLVVLPGLVLAFFLVYAVYLGCSREESGLSGVLRGSVDIARGDAGATLALVLFTVVLGVLGSVTVVGVLITTPLCICVLAHAALQGSGDRVRYRP